MALPSLASGVDHELAEHENTLNALADRLRVLMANPLIQEDAQANTILHRILRSRDAVQIDTHMDALLIRVGELIAERTGDQSERIHLSALTGPRARSGPPRRTLQSNQTHANGLSLPARIFMNL